MARLATFIDNPTILGPDQPGLHVRPEDSLLLGALPGTFSGGFQRQTASPQPSPSATPSLLPGTFPAQFVTPTSSPTQTSSSSSPMYSSSSYSPTYSPAWSGGGGGSSSGSVSWGPYSPTDLQYLRDFASGAIPAFDATPVWQAMIDAQQRNLEQIYANMLEGFNATGNYQSTPFAGAAVDFWSQTAKDQAALLGQLQMSAYESAKARQLSGASDLAGVTSGWLSQQSAQDAQARLQSEALSAQAALQAQALQAEMDRLRANQDFQDYIARLNNSFQAAQMLYSGGLSTSQLMQQLASQNALALLGSANDAMRSLYGTEVNTSMLYPQWMLQNLMLGSQLGGQQYQIGSQELNALYNEWLRTQAEYNPLLQYMFTGVTGSPQYAYPYYPQSQLPQMLGGIGSLIGSLGSLSDLINLFR